MFRWVWVLLILGVSVQAEDTVIPDPDWTVARAQFATAISNREPVDDVVLLASPVNKVYFFTDLRHLQERTVTHRWKFNGRVVSIVPFDVKGPRWRVFSKANVKMTKQNDKIVWVAIIPISTDDELKFDYGVVPDYYHP